MLLTYKYNLFQKPISDLNFFFNIDKEAFSPKLPDNLKRIIEATWYKSKNNNANLSDGELFHFDSCENIIIPDSRKSNVICNIGSVGYGTYDAMCQILDGKTNIKSKWVADYWNPQYAFTLSQIYPLSTFPVMIFENKYFVMRKKSQFINSAGLGKLSFPGAGYLDIDRDTFIHGDKLFPKNTRRIICREITEETSLKVKEIEKIDILGITSDTFPGSHRNPAIHSAVHVSISIEELIERKALEKDSWEHEGPYIVIPIDNPELLTEIIESEIKTTNKKLSKKSSSKIKGMNKMQSIDTTGKAYIMLYLTGKYLFGDKWFKDILDKHILQIRLESF